MRDPMLDEEFLKQLVKYPHKFVWAKIISLNFEEFPMEEITGKITSGNISIDGSSAVRRTCSLTLVANEVNINNFYWSLNTKFKVEIGLENWINSEYPEIIWFKQGMFLISTFNCSVGTNNYTINIQGKDKMVLLNGEVGGIVPASWDFGKIDVTNPDGTISQDFYPIKDIVLQAVHEYAQEPWENIIVNDLDDYGIELLEYMGDSPFYFIMQEETKGDNNSREIFNMTMEDMDCYVRLDSWNGYERVIGEDWVQSKFSQLENIEFTDDTSPAGALDQPHFTYEKLMEQLDPSGNVTETVNYLRAKIYLPMEIDNGDGTKRIEPDTRHVYTVAKITKDNGLQVCGYRVCDIIYPYDLIASPGETLTSVLDKLVTMLGNFEYFYDVDGRFVFQKKRTFVDVSYNNIVNEHAISEEVWADSGEFSSKFSFTFDKNLLVSSIQNSPNLSNLKNDFSLWGERMQGDIAVPIHMRYAVDHKPMWYKVIGHHIQRNRYGLAYNEEDNIDGNYRETDLQYIDDKGNIVNKSTEYVYDDAGTIYCTEEGLKQYQTLLKNYQTEALSGEISSLIEVDGESTTYRKKKNTNGLSEDWWEVQDWARYYAIVAAFLDNKNPKNLTQTQLEEYYPKEEVRTYKKQGWKGDSQAHIVEQLGYGTDYQASKTQENVQVIFDIPSEQRWISHATGCTHNYLELLPGSASDAGVPANATVYVYKPTFLGEIEYDYIETEEGGVEIDLSQYQLEKYKIVDWREIIYQMANDYRRHYREEDFLIKVRDNNKIEAIVKDEIGREKKISTYDSWYPKGYTGYEKYYIDFEMNLSQGVVAYWRELYNYDQRGQKGRYLPTGEFESDNLVSPWLVSSSYGKGERVKHGGQIYRSLSDGNRTEPGAIDAKWAVSEGEFRYNSDGWNPDILNNPEALNFWFDFLDTSGDLNKYSVSNIGQRSKATNDTTIKAIYFRETPNVIFYKTEEDQHKQENWRKPGYCYMHVPAGLDNLFSISSRGKNAMDVIDEYLYSYTYPASAVNLNTVPIYYLSPNTLIYLEDKETGAVGEYIAQKFSIQLGTSAQMTINAVQTAKRLY